MLNTRVVLNGEKKIIESLPNPNNISLEERSNINKIKEKDLLPSIIGSSFVLDYISNYDFRNLTIDQLKRALNEEDFKDLLSSNKDLENLIKQEQQFKIVAANYIEQNSNGKDTSSLEKELYKLNKEISSSRFKIDKILDEVFGNKFIDYKTETQIKELSLYKEILSISNLENINEMNKILLINNLIQTNSNLGLLNNIKEWGTEFNRFSNQLNSGIKNNISESELISSYNGMLMAMDKFYDRMELKNSDYEKNPTYTLYKLEINDFQNTKQYIELVDSMKESNPNLLAKKYIVEIPELSSNREEQTTSIGQHIKDTIDSIEGFSIGGR